MVAVLQYEFTIPGEEKRWMVMWDYNIGLVRTTHLFKCQGYSKVGEHNPLGMPLIQLTVSDDPGQNAERQPWPSRHLP